MMPLLQVQDASLSINQMPVLHSISFELARGKALGLVGESGAGKSMTAMSIIGLLPAGARLSGSILFDGEDLTQCNELAMCALRGSQISMAFQEPMTALNPVQSIGAQVAEVFVIHRQASKSAALVRAAEVLERVGLPNAEIPLSRYPFELSGGQRQRVVIAIAVALRPGLLIADEPTSALDVTTEAQILDLLCTLCTQESIALLFVSHDLAAVARVSDHIAIMKDGSIVETGPTTEIFTEMRHPYSLALRAASTYELQGTARQTQSHREVSDSRRILEVNNLTCCYTLPQENFFAKPATFRALDNVSFSLNEGENLGLIGESGSGKSTLVRAILGLEPLRDGTIDIAGSRFSPAPATHQMALRHKIQAVFQDPYGSFNPRHRVERIVAEPLNLLATRLNASELGDRVADCLENVGLSASDGQKYPHEFSGGQRQRIAIARALVVSPAIIILDEATSALDVSVRARILKLLAELSDRLGISYLFVSHDLDIVRAVTDRVMILQAGKLVEQGVTQKLFSAPQHPYTQSLLDAKPTLQEEIYRRQSLDGTHAVNQQH